ncbi:carotenoid biosynthesis protein [Mangrovibacterium marinum]|uniref:Putative membrane protein n=1 Tax=Mangrovibacterium marinum TaxID=1639118 RepID=A0A2T5BYS5_9BACT|nr:carotenoid biosynthesis protein [Mangrovibacterium marinum]PTN07383.1 putative membrane protein [Mangrovibacterium marinum]
MIKASKLLWPVRIGLAILYLVGIVGFSFPQTEGLFKQLSAWNLFLSFGVLVLFHQPRNARVYGCLLLVAVAAFVAELIGTQTGYLFGSYTYGPVLGLKLWQTPLLIGVNWLVLCYGIYVALSAFNLKWWMSVIGGLLMVAFDLLMEPVAVRLDMWTWENGQIPLRNYIDWFWLSVLFLSAMKFARLNIRNPLAVWIVVWQLIFFAGLNISLNLL